MGDTQYAVGLKKAFAPANQKLRELTQRDDFGAVRSLALRYAQVIPTVDDLRSASPMREYFLDHLCHPLAVLRLLGGPAATLYYERAAERQRRRRRSRCSRARSRRCTCRGRCRCARSRSAPRSTATAPSAWAENNTQGDVRAQPAAARPALRARRATTPTTCTRVTVWEPEFSLGQLYNTGAFLLGYYGELAALLRRGARATPVEIGGIDWAEEGIRIFDAFAEGPGTVIAL